MSQEMVIIIILCIIIYIGSVIVAYFFGLFIGAAHTMSGAIQSTETKETKTNE